MHLSEIRSAVTLGLPLLEMIAKRTTNDKDDLVVDVLHLILENDKLATDIAALVDARRATKSK